MNPRRVVFGVVLAVGMALVVAPPAAADASNSGGVETRLHSAALVEGYGWSAPTYPVACQRSDRQISCSAERPGDVEAMQCFMGALVEGASTTICTIYEGHVGAIQAAGGRQIVVSYGCSFGDLLCASFEGFGRGMAIATTGMMFVVASNMRFDTSTLLWSAATAEWSFWQWAVLIVLFGSMVWAIAAAAVSGDRAELIGAIVRSFLAVPALAITLWLTGHLLNAVDDMTWYILNRDGPAGLLATLQRVMWAGGQANYFFAFLIHGLLMVAMFLLMLVFAFRNITLAALIAVGPIAWMMFPIRTIGPQWVVRYVSAVVVLLLTGPLTIGFITLIINGLSGVQTIWDPQSWPLLVGLVLVAFAPFAIFGLFSFVGAAAADSVGSSVGGAVSRAGSSATRQVMAIPSRMGASPAGVLAGGGRGGSLGGQSAGTASRTGAARGATSPAGRASSSPRPNRPAAQTSTPAAAPAAPASPAPSPSTRGGQS